MKDVTIFVCGKPRKLTPCSTSDCKGSAVAECQFALGGKKAGQKCGRALCASCSATGVCPPHRRLTEKRASA